jgi:hypothetical protein
MGIFSSLMRMLGKHEDAYTFLSPAGRQKYIDEIVGQLSEGQPDTSVQASVKETVVEYARDNLKTRLTIDPHRGRIEVEIVGGAEKTYLCVMYSAAGAPGGAAEQLNETLWTIDNSAEDWNRIGPELKEEILALLVKEKATLLVTDGSVLIRGSENALCYPDGVERARATIALAGRVVAALGAR